MMMHHRLLWLVGALAISTWTGSAVALDDATKVKARNLVNDGVAQFERGEFERAREQFMAAHALAEVPTVAVWAARAHERVGRLLEASALYRQALAMQPNELWTGQVQQKAQGAATEALTALESRIPVLQLELVGGNAETTLGIDETVVTLTAPSLEQRLDPGAHHVKALRAGKVVREETITLAEGERRRVEWTLPAPEPVSPVQPAVKLQAIQFRPTQPQADTSASTSRTLTWLSLGVGLAGLAVGTVAGVTTGKKHSELRDAGCSDDACRGSQFQDRVDAHNTWRSVSMVGFIVGGVGAAAGLTLWLTTPTTPHSSGVGLTLSPGRVAMAGEF